MTNYVLGFMFSHNLKDALLIRKNKPDWQKGKLNGIGGKVECDEGFSLAMAREFEEECGIKTKPEDWLSFGEMSGSDFFVAMFAATGEIKNFKNMTDEECEIRKSDHICELECVDNLPWLVLLAKSFLRTGVPEYTKAAYP